MNTKTKRWAVAGIAISWATFWLFLFSPFGLLAWAGILVYLVSQKSPLRWYLLLSAWLFVPGCSFLTGTARYFTATAALRGVGGPKVYHGIDQETRVPVTSSGCIFVGFEPFVIPANNAAVELWTNLLGYQRGAYTGSFPTQTEAAAMLKTADTLVVVQSGKYYQFKPLDQVVEVDTVDFHHYRYGYVPFDRAVGRVIDNQRLLFTPITAEEENNDPTIYLIDIANKTLLIQYHDY